MKRLCCSCRSQFAWIVPPRVFSIGTSSKCTLPLLIAFHKQHWAQLSMLLISHWSFPWVRPCHHSHGFMHSRCSEGFIKGWIPYSFNPSQDRQKKIHNLENTKIEINLCQTKYCHFPTIKNNPCLLYPSGHMLLAHLGVGGSILTNTKSRKLNQTKRSNKQTN